MPLAGSLALLSRPDPARNFFESTDACVYYPIRELVDEAERTGAITAQQPIWIEADPMLGMVEQVYPTLARHQLQLVTSDCRCSAERPALLVTVPYPTGLISDPGAVAVPEATAACIGAVRASYQHVLERAIDGYPTGLLGVGCK